MVKYFACVALLACCTVAQEIPRLSVTPSYATVLLGDTHVFRAVNFYGRPASFVRWDSSSSNAVIMGEGSDIEVDFRQPGEYEIHAFSAEGSASAKIRVVAFREFPYGATKWRVDSFDGCHTKQLVPAVPAPGSTNDIFMVDECPRGRVVRALTADGLENWRTWISEKELDLTKLGSYEPKALLAKSVCDNIKPDMSRDDVTKLATDAKAQLPDSEKAKDVWVFEEEKGECRVTFREGKVAKKQKVIAN